VWWKVALGAAVIVSTLREIFQDLFHPAQSGALSEWIAGRIFVILRPWPSLRASAGPLAVVTCIAVWSSLVILGFALVYWSVFPAAFEFRTKNPPTGHDDFVWCLYYSLQMITTLGLSDIQPSVNWMRILSSAHTLIGFSILTASLTWVVMLFPALGRTRTLARKAHAISAASQQSGVPLATEGLQVVLTVLADEVIRARVDLIHFPILLYFDSTDSHASLASGVLELSSLAKSGLDSARDPRVRFAAQLLEESLQQLADHLGNRLDVHGSTEQVFRAFADYHRQLTSNS
jgi:hypothetical protein